MIHQRHLDLDLLVLLEFITFLDCDTSSERLVHIFKIDKVIGVDHVELWLLLLHPSSRIFNTHALALIKLLIISLVARLEFNNGMPNRLKRFHSLYSGEFLIQAVPRFNCSFL